MRFPLHLLHTVFGMTHNFSVFVIPESIFTIAYLGDETLVGRVGEEWAAEERDLATTGACALVEVPGGAPVPEPA